MDEERYVCMKCKKSQLEPVICAACGHTDLLDMHIPSERTLLESMSARFRWDLLLLVLLVLFLFTVGLPYGLHWALINQLELSRAVAGFLSFVIPSVIFVGMILFLSFKSEDFPEQVSMSPSEKEQWQELMDEPVPLSNEEKEEVEKRKAARRRQRRQQ